MRTTSYLVGQAPNDEFVATDFSDEVEVTEGFVPGLLVDAIASSQLDDAVEDALQMRVDQVWLFLVLVKHEREALPVSHPRRRHLGWYSREKSFLGSS